LMPINLSHRKKTCKIGYVLREIAPEKTSTTMRTKLEMLYIFKFESKIALKKRKKKKYESKKTITFYLTYIDQLIDRKTKYRNKREVRTTN
jgi:hypothetical protein